MAPVVAVWIINAFVKRDEPFSGNPAAVVLLEPPHRVSDNAMQRLAAQMNLSETVFLEQIESAAFTIRWFTPEAEVGLCGHATLAAAHFVYERCLVGRLSPVVFQTRHSGNLSVRLADVISAASLTMDFPALPAVESRSRTQWEQRVVEAVGAEGNARIYHSPDDLIIRVESRAAVEASSPQFGLLNELMRTQPRSTDEWRGVILTSSAGSEEGAVDFYSRFFAPNLGINEDPVTGSAHCALATIYGQEGRPMRAAQLSRRGGELSVRLSGDRVELSGEAVVIMQGSISLATLTQ